MDMSLSPECSGVWPHNQETTFGQNTTVTMNDIRTPYVFQRSPHVWENQQDAI